MRIQAHFLQTGAARKNARSTRHELAHRVAQAQGPGISSGIKRDSMTTVAGDASREIRSRRSRFGDWGCRSWRKSSRSCRKSSRSCRGRASTTTVQSIELHIKHQVGVRRNVRRRAPSSISTRGGNSENRMLTKRHLGNTLIPSLNNLTHANLSRKLPSTIS